jgi:hypothetical protein
VDSPEETPRRIQELPVQHFYKPVQHFYKADANYGMGVAKGLDASRIFTNWASAEEKLVPADRAKP